jgi:hypothetical protein
MSGAQGLAVLSYNGNLRFTLSGNTQTFPAPSREAMAKLFEDVRNELLEMEKIPPLENRDV